MIGISLLLLVPVVMWIAQSIALRACGLPIRWRLTSRDAPRVVRNTGRAVTQVGLAAVVVGYPLCIGQSVVKHYSALLPLDGTRAQFVQGAVMAIIILTGLMLIWLACERIEFEVRHERRRWMRRLALLIPSALFGAFVEEFVFRGVVQFDLLRSGVNANTSIVFAGSIFAAAHYVRATKRKWTIFGHLALGILLSTAFAVTRNLWLATGIHTGGIFVILGVRPFVRYRGPAWLTGESIFPFAGIAGVLGLALLTWAILQRYGTI